MWTGRLGAGELDGHVGVGATDGERLQGAGYGMVTVQGYCTSCALATSAGAGAYCTTSLSGLLSAAPRVISIVPDAPGSTNW